MAELPESLTLFADLPEHERQAVSAIAESVDVPAGEAIVREGVNVKVSDSDQDDFVRNRVTILAECRVALVVWRPDFFSLPKLSHQVT